MRYLILIVGLFLSQLTTQVEAAQGIPGMPEIPQIPAFLPMAHSVPPTKASPIDGEWVITSIGKRVRIQSGRAFAVDPWTHMFVLKISPMMVVIKDIVRTGSGQYSGQDLPLMGKWQARLDPTGNLSVSVPSMLGPVNYTMMPVSLDNNRAFNAEKNGRYRPRRERPPQPAPEEEYYEEQPQDEEYEDEGGYEEDGYEEDGYEEGDYEEEYEEYEYEDEYQ